jgi:hypothetical protein
MSNIDKPRVKGRGRLRPCAICYEDRWEDASHFPRPNRKGGEVKVPLCPTHHKLLDDGRLNRSEYERLMNSGLFETNAKTVEEFIDWARSQGYDYSLEDLKRKFWGALPQPTEDICEHYFAYGSNLCRKQIQDRCPSAREFGRGSIKDYYLGFTHKSVKWNCGTADIIRREGDAAWGMIYSISNADLSVMDNKEGSNYRRIPCTVTMDYRTIPNVWTYEVIDKGQYKPSACYLNIIKCGAKRLNFPESYLQMLNGIMVQ